MTTLAQALRQWAGAEVVKDARMRVALWMAAFVLATALGAQVAVKLPWTPVPMTLQPLFVLLAGAYLGPRAGAGAMAAYVTLGAAGAPVFANGGFGVGWLLGPTGGYLLAAPAAAYVAGFARRATAGWLRAFALFCASVAVLYVGGVGHLILLSGVSPAQVWTMGVVPFLLGDLTKILVALVLVRGVRIRGLGT